MSQLLQTVAQSYMYESTESSAGSPFVMIIGLVMAVVILAAHWKMFEKAKKPGWAVLVPIYNSIVLLSIIGRPWWWILLFLIPVVNIIVAVIVAHETAKVFGKEIGTTLLLIFLPFIGYFILGFGDAKYKGALKH